MGEGKKRGAGRWKREVTNVFFFPLFRCCPRRCALRTYRQAVEQGHTVTVCDPHQSATRMHAKKRSSDQTTSAVVVVATSLDDAVRRLQRTPTAPVRVRWALDGQQTETLESALCSVGATMHRLDMVDTFHGDGALPAAGWWLRCRESHSVHNASAAVGTPQSDRTWTLRIVQWLAPQRRPDGDAQHARAHACTDIHDEGAITALVSPDSDARDPSVLSLGIYARMNVSRTVFDLTPPPPSLQPTESVRVLVDKASVGGSGTGACAVQGSAVLTDAHVAAWLRDLLVSVGVDPARVSPRSKVAAYLERRRPALHARLVERGALLPA